MQHGIDSVTGMAPAPLEKTPLEWLRLRYGLRRCGRSLSANLEHRRARWRGQRERPTSHCGVSLQHVLDLILAASAASGNPIVVDDLEALLGSKLREPLADQAARRQTEE